LFALHAAHAQTREEVVGDLIMQAAEALDRASEQRQARKAQQVQNEITRLEDEQRAREQQSRDDELRRQKEAAAVRRWPGAGAMTPPLEPGEIHAETENGCGIVMSGNGSTQVDVMKYDDTGKPVMDGAGKPVMEKLALRDYIRSLVWSGDCPSGLAHGLGALAPRALLTSIIDYKSEMFYGRTMSRSLFPEGQSDSWTLHYAVGDSLRASVPAWRDPFVPRYGKESEGQPATKLMLIRLSKDAEGKTRAQSTAVAALIQPCAWINPMPRGCSYEKNFDVYAVRTITTGEQKPVIATMPCPDPKVLKSCTSLWQQLADPLIQQIQPVIAQSEAHDKTRRQQLTSLNSMYLLNQRINAMAQSAEAEKDKERRQAAARAADAEAAKKVAAAAAAERAAAEKAERAFKAKLATLNAGQLFVLADELKAEGKTAQARDVLRTLIVRFPDHALASNAATALAAL
jgi:hypothetical protein